jgi:hypothetical protein
MQQKKLRKKTEAFDVDHLVEVFDLINVELELLERAPQ